MEKLTDIEKNNLNIAMELMFVVAEFNSIEQDISKILLFEKYGEKYITIEGLSYIQDLTSGGFKYSKKIDVLEEIIKNNNLNINIKDFRSLGKSRNILLHAIYFIDGKKEKIEDKILLRKIKSGSFSKESKEFNKLSKLVRADIQKIGKFYNLSFEDGSINL